MGKISFQQFEELVNKDMNKGLAPNLAFNEPSIDYGMKGLDVAMGGYMAEVAFLGNTVTNHVQACELLN